MGRDRDRARDYDGLVHVVERYWSSQAYLCQSVRREDAAMHGVWTHEPTTCLWCVLRKEW